MMFILQRIFSVQPQIDPNTTFAIIPNTIDLCPKPGQTGFYPELALYCLLCDWLAGRAWNGSASDYRFLCF
jgi:hypothetical protein